MLPIRISPISLDEYENLISQYPDANFLQSSQQARRSNAQPMGIFASSRLIGGFLYKQLRVKRLFKRAYLPRGWFLFEPVDELIPALTEAFKQWIKQEKLAWLTMDPLWIWHYRNPDGKIIRGGTLKVIAHFY